MNKEDARALVKMCRSRYHDKMRKLSDEFNTKLLKAIDGLTL